MLRKLFYVSEEDGIRMHNEHPEYIRAMSKSINNMSYSDICINLDRTSEYDPATDGLLCKLYSGFLYMHLQPGVPLTELARSIYEARVSLSFFFSDPDYADKLDRLDKIRVDNKTLLSFAKLSASGNELEINGCNNIQLSAGNRTHLKLQLEDFVRYITTGVLSTKELVPAEKDEDAFCLILNTVDTPECVTLDSDDSCIAGSIDSYLKLFDILQFSLNVDKDLYSFIVRYCKDYADAYGRQLPNTMSEQCDSFEFIRQCPMLADALICMCKDSGNASLHHLSEQLCVIFEDAPNNLFRNYRALRSVLHYAKNAKELANVVMYAEAEWDDWEIAYLRFMENQRFGLNQGAVGPVVKLLLFMKQYPNYDQTIVWLMIKLLYTAGGEYVVTKDNKAAVFYTLACILYKTFPDGCIGVTNKMDFVYLDSKGFAYMPAEYERPLELLWSYKINNSLIPTDVMNLYNTTNFDTPCGLLRYFHATPDPSAYKDYSEHKIEY